MKRRLLFLSALVVMVAVAALAAQRNRDPELLLLQWANKAQAETPPTAILIEMGVKDQSPADWSGRATVKGAKVVHREGYRFRKDDKLTEPNGWKASSHRGMRVPAKNPQVSKTEGIATVGVVLHLADVTEGAEVTVNIEAAKERAAQSVTVPLKDVFAGKRADKLAEGGLVVRLITTATPVATGKTEDDFPAACYGPDGTLWVAYNSYTIRDEGRRIEAPSLKQQPENFKQLYTPEFADQVMVKSYRDGKWSKPLAVTGPKESIARCAIAAEANGTVWVGYSAFRQGTHEVFARPIRLGVGKAPVLGAEEKVFGSKGSAVTPVMCTSQGGDLRLAYQIWSAERPAYIRLVHRKDNKWAGKTDLVAPGTQNFWYPGLAAGLETDHVGLVWDGYGSGDYDVWMCPQQKQIAIRPVATTNNFEARPSAAYDPKGRLWIAFEEGPERWGKDYGALVADKGDPLYTSRSVRVVCLDSDGRLKKPVAQLPVSTTKKPAKVGEAPITQGFEKATRYAYPKIGIDGKGRVWLTYRQSFGSRYSSHPGSYWITFARRLDGDQWSEPIEVHHSDGLLDSRPALLPHKSGGLVIVHNTDGRYTNPETVDNDVYLSHVNLPGDPVEPKLEGYEAGVKFADQLAQRDEASVKNIKAYRVVQGGKKLQLLRGEFHRHTEISWDGGADGSLEDMFRYAIDAADMDWIGNGDHDNGAGREYSWWLTQKFSDAYRVPETFTPMFTYERSVSYPMGHRNCMFAKRGIRTLPRLAAAEAEAVGGVHPDDTKMLYRYLHEFGGLCASHTSATGMGTDWRDNDPVVEPIVEIYQGDRNSYEAENAPRAGHDPKSGKLPANIAGWFPKGFLTNALGAKGYKLGFQSSSDHWSTHISYFIILAERNDRQALIDAVKKRHCYGATDNIILDVRSGPHLMGDEFKTEEAPALKIHVTGTSQLAKVEVLRDSEVVATLEPKGAQFDGTWTDPAPRAGTRYYYVRVVQADGELAWSSPLWITRAGKE